MGEAALLWSDVGRGKEGAFIPCGEAGSPPRRVEDVKRLVDDVPTSSMDMMSKASG